jgi:hypothetical protein
LYIEIWTLNYRFSGGVKMGKLKPCKYCGKSNIAVERWSSGGMMYMVKCNNPDCPVPPEGYPTGRNLEKVKDEWNKWN